VKAAILRGPRDLRLESASEPRLAADEALVRVSIAGLCGTDYRIWTGDRPVAYPRIMGHEFAGVVEEVGRDVHRLRAGDRVVVEPNYSCGRCALCHEGNRNLCLDRVTIGIDVDGCFAELTRVPSRCCWPVPPKVLDETIVITEPLAVVVRAVNRAGPKPGESAAVVGVGSLGLLALQVLRARGLRVMVVSRTSRRFALAHELGAERAGIVAEGPLEAAARDFSGREGVDLVIETAGTPEAVAHAITMVRPGGRVVLTGLPHAPSSVSFFSVVRREVSIVGSMIYQDEFGDAVRLLESGAVKTDLLVTRRFPLAAIAEAFAAHHEATAIKIAIVP
jgi:2-desacetyl-2-hydroxyethyl bacteriochlorophyllide A dehydrogenase